MKKSLLLKITSLTLGIVMALGVGAVASQMDSTTEVRAAGTQPYTKVTSAPSDWSGEYLIVYESGKVAFDGSLTTLDAVSNTIGVTITNNSISLDSKYSFTIAKSGSSYTVKSASGYYVGQTSNANGLKSSTSTSYANTISINDDGSVNFVSGGAYLRYNATSGQYRFRYFKSGTYTSQKAIHLYKLEASEPAQLTVTNSIPETMNIGDTFTPTVTDGTSSVEGYTLSANPFDIVSISNGVITAKKVGTTTITVSKATYKSATFDLEVVDNSTPETPAGATTTTLNVGEYGVDNGWVNAEQYLNFSKGDVSFVVQYSGNNNNSGKYYNTKEPHTWRLYESESATLTINLNGGNLFYVQISYLTTENGVPNVADTIYGSGAKIYVNNSDTLTISVDSNDDKSGKLFITEITVVYVAGPKIDVALTGDQELDINETATLVATPANGATGTVIWAANNDNVALTVDGNTVTVKGVKGGEAIVTASLAGCNDVSYTFTVIKKLSSITVTGPDKTSYYELETFDTTGMVVTATYNDGTTKDLAASDYTYDPSGALTVENTKVTISYTEGEITKTAEVAISVTEKVVNSLSWEQRFGGNAPILFVGETITKSQLTGTITATYDDDTSTGITLDKVEHIYLVKESVKKEVFTDDSNSYTVTLEDNDSYFALAIDDAITDNAGSSKLSVVDTLNPISVTTEGGETTAGLSFADKAYRTDYSTEKQVWSQNGITLTNNKGSSTNNVADYANPARMYANSSITIEAPDNITKIEVTANNGTYATALTNSAGAEAKAIGSIVTITPTGTSSSYTIAKLTAQVRLDSISVTYEVDSTTVEYANVDVKAQKIVVDFANYLHAQLDVEGVCDVKGYGSDAFNTAWNNITAEYNKYFGETPSAEGYTAEELAFAKSMLINATAKADGDVLQRALSRYNMVVDEAEGLYEAFIEGRSVEQARNNFLGITNNETSVMLIVVMSSISLLSFACFFFLGKRKEQQ